MQIGTREKGHCLVCSEETEVVALEKDAQTVKLCRKHVWDALKAPKNGTAQSPHAPAPGGGK